MKSIGEQTISTKLILVLGIAQLGLVGCATVPDKSELQRLSQTEVKSSLIGNTLTRRTEYGRWAEFVETQSSGHAKAWGSGWSQSATASYEFTDDGQLCSTYAGEHDWSTPENRGCMAYYTDAEGNYYAETLVDTWDPKEVGDIDKIEIKPGDDYGLKP